MIAIASLLLVIAVSLLLTRFATVVLVATGMSREHARFQARSAFTGTGFTTREAEFVVNHPLRRKVVMLLMLLGNAGVVAAAGTLIIGFQSTGTGKEWIRVLELVAGLLALVFLSRSAWIDRRLTRAIAGLLGRFTDLSARDAASLVHLSGGYAVEELAVPDGGWLAGTSLGELDDHAPAVRVLGVMRRDGTYHGSPTPSTVLSRGDALILYGHRDALSALGRGGDRPTAAPG